MCSRPGGFPEYEQGASMTDLQAKMDKFEAEAAECERLADRAVDRCERAMFDRLALHYRELAADFAKAISARNAA